MSATLDANVLLYASDTSSAVHREALSFVHSIGAGDELFYVFWPTVMAYLRISTHPAIFADPLSPNDALGNIERLLDLPHVQTAGEPDRFWSSFRTVAEEADVRGNLVADGHLVALMLAHGVRTIWTRDRDYRRFRGIEARDPFEAPGTRR